MSEPKRILIGGFTTETGGMESYIMNLYRHVDRSRLQFDFVNNLSSDIAFSDEIKALGGRIFNVPMIRNGIKEHYKAMDDLFGNTHYEALYYQANRKLKNADLFKAAKKHGVPRRILHSHNTRDLDESRVNNIRIKLTEKSLNSYLTERFACSEGAGKWMFPGATDVKVVNNGVDTAIFDYDDQKAATIRMERGAENKKIFGTVGRICREKNSLFLVDIFNEIHKKDENTLFWHIGGGALEDEMRKKISEYGLEDSYIMLGRQSNVADFLNAIDLLLLPSVHEGFPITLVEAQCSGMKCLVADNITRSVDITGNVSFKSIDDSASDWADEALALSSYQRSSCRDILIDKGFDEQGIADWFQDFILNE